MTALCPELGAQVTVLAVCHASFRPRLSPGSPPKHPRRDSGLRRHRHELGEAEALLVRAVKMIPAEQNFTENGRQAGGFLGGPKGQGAQHPCSGAVGPAGAAGLGEKPELPSTEPGSRKEDFGGPRPPCLQKLQSENSGGCSQEGLGCVAPGQVLPGPLGSLRRGPE